MARTSKARTVLTRNAGTSTAAAGLTIDATLVTNGVTIPAAGDHRGRIVLIVTNSAGSAKVVTIKGGPDGGASGDLAVSVAASGEQTIVLGDSARHLQADKAYYVNFASGFTGSIKVLAVPR